MEVIEKRISYSIFTKKRAVEKCKDVGVRQASRALSIPQGHRTYLKGTEHTSRALSIPQGH